VPPWSGCTSAKLSCPCNGTMTAPTRCCDADCTPSSYGSGTGRRLSPPASQGPAPTIQLSRVSLAALG
jgi:hypothetical protein